MGLRYLLFRLKHELLRKTGLLAKQFPVDPPAVWGPSLQEVLVALEKWPWQGRESMNSAAEAGAELKSETEELLSGKFRLFGTIQHSFENRHDWHLHPGTGFLYEKNRHWTLISDFSMEAGDIKFIWERGRFGQLQTIMRFDLQTGGDHSAWVMEEIESFIDHNPLNCGPHYRCSQEISLRIMNWLGAISFYRNSPELSEARWKKIWHSLYWQVHHVRQNIDFSRIAVRNNHAITETLMLYIFGRLFPDAPGCREWQQSGKRWLEEEIAYQIYPDGSYLQFSMNYHRVVIQLLTLAIRFAERSGEKFSLVVYARAKASLEFLRFFQDPFTGWLPNYGANDGALFFRFSSTHFRDYRPQLEALRMSLGEKFKPDFEDANWFGEARDLRIETIEDDGVSLFPQGGFAGIRRADSVLFFRCGRHKDRPSQADNLHIDLWYRGKNILRDAGSYKYNASPEEVRYFFGTESHNAIMLDGADQMLKGPRFVWLHWSQATLLEVSEEDEWFVLQGEIKVFGQLAPGIRHRRTIRASKLKPEWWVEDQLIGTENREACLFWHPGPGFESDFQLEVRDGNGNQLNTLWKQGWYSENYGKKEPAPYLAFVSGTGRFYTKICQK
jgi:hypothetical protein